MHGGIGARHGRPGAKSGTRSAGALACAWWWDAASTIHHVAIYIGNGMMVNAPFTGAFVRIDSMYQPGGLIGAVRPAG